MRAVAVAIASLSIAGGCGRSQLRDQDGPHVRMHVLDCGHLRFNDLAMFADDGAYRGEQGDLIVPCYLIRHPAGDLLWDTGLPEALADLHDGLSPPDFPAHLSVPVRLTEQLRQLGIGAADIEMISMSHSHSDHSGNANLFVGALWIVDADERAYMFDAAHRANTRDFSNYDRLEQVRTHVIENDGDYDVFGDGSVTMIKTPGHTPGHRVLRVNLAHTGPVLLTGDLWHLPQSRARRSVPAFNTSREQTLASMDKIEALAVRIGARVVRQHVVADFEALPRAPQAVE